MRYVALLLTVLGCFFFESFFVNIFPLYAFDGQRIIVPRFLLTLLLLMTVYYLRNETIIYAIIFGLIYDIYYTGVLGVYLFLFPLAVYFTLQLMKIFQTNIFTAAFVTIVNVAIVEYLVYLLNFNLFNAQMTLIEFGDYRLWPTLILNMIFFLLIVFPIRKLLLYLKKIKLDD